MTDTELSPGEARMRVRRRREILTYVTAAIIGATVGFLMVFANNGEGDLYSGEWDKIVLDPAIAIGLAIALIVGVIIMPAWVFTISDELVRQRNYIGYTGGSMAVMGGAPAWAVLHAGGLVPAPSAAGVWLLGFIATFVTFGVAWLRSR